MLRRLRNRRAVSIIEYAMLVLIILGVLFVMQFYVSRAFSGKWKSTGDSFGFGRQHSSTKTASCAYAQTSATYGVWYDENCYQQAVTGCSPGDLTCETNARLGCARAYCCEANDEPAGHSNCS